jgi:hypothetical protein
VPAVSLQDVTLILAVLGVVLGAISLAWQAATLVQAGSRIRAGLRHGARNADTAVTGKPGTQTMATLLPQGFTEEVLGVEVRNAGRRVASIITVQGALKNGVKVSAVGDSLDGPSLPHRLEPKNTATWLLPATSVRAAVGASAQIRGSDPCRMWMEIELGTGKVVKTRETMILGSRSALDRF